mgnify:CR=1 FL=1
MRRGGVKRNKEITLYMMMERDRGKVREKERKRLDQAEAEVNE